MQRAAIVLVLMCVAAPAAAWTEKFVGVWTGEAVDNLEREFPVRIVLAPDGSASVLYESYDCEGTLALVEEKGGTRVYRETLSRGREACIDNGRVMLSSDGESMAYAWDGEDVTAGGTLLGWRFGAEPSACAECDERRVMQYYDCVRQKAPTSGSNAGNDGACFADADAAHVACAKALCPLSPWAPR